MRNDLISAINLLIEEYIEFDIIHSEPLEIKRINDNSTSIRINVIHKTEPKKNSRGVLQPIEILNKDELVMYNNLPDTFKRIEFIENFLIGGKTRPHYYNLFKKLLEKGYIYLDGYTNKYKRTYIKLNEE